MVPVRTGTGTVQYVMVTSMTALQGWGYNCTGTNMKIIGVSAPDRYDPPKTEPLDYSRGAPS